MINSGQKLSRHAYLNKEHIAQEEFLHSYSPSVLNDLYQVAHVKKYELPYTNKDFYLCQTATIDWLTLGALRHDPMQYDESGKYIGPVPYKNKIWARQSCPTPLYKMSVFKFHHLSGSLEFLWTLPPAWRCEDIITHKQKYLDDKKWQQIAKFVLLDASGDLLEWIKKENGEKLDAVIKINKVKE